MNKIVAALVVWMVVAPGMVWGEDKQVTELKTFKEKLGYIMGFSVGGDLKQVQEEIEFTSFVKGITDAFEGNKALLTESEIAVVQQQFAQKMQILQEQSLTKMREENKVAGEKYLELNKAKKGVIVTASGLQYEVLKKGNGEMPKASDRVKVDYTGQLIDGTEFDSSIKRGEPVVFGVDQVIPGWSEALQLMNVGSKYRLVIPSALAYGENGRPRTIEPNSTLVFEVVLHSIEK